MRTLNAAQIGRLARFHYETNQKPRDTSGHYISPMNSESGYLYVARTKKIEICIPRDLGGGSILSDTTYDTFDQAAEMVANIFESYSLLEEFVYKHAKISFRGDIEKTKKLKIDIDKASADLNFAYILENIERPLSELVKQYGTKTLVNARKTLTVSDFLNTYV